MENGIAILCFLIFVMFDVHSFYFENCLTSTVKSMLLVIYSALPTLKYTGLLSILSQVFILMVLVALWPAGTAEGFVTLVTIKSTDTTKTHNILFLIMKL